jgi:hypothetical protein
MEDLSASLDGVIAPPITAPLLAAPWTPPLLVFAPTGKPPLPPSPGIPPVCSCSMFKTSASVSSAVNAQGDACRDATPAFDSEEGISFSGAWDAAGTGASSTSASSGSMRANAEVGGVGVASRLAPVGSAEVPTSCISEIEDSRLWLDITGGTLALRAAGRGRRVGRGTEPFRRRAPGLSIL